MTTSGNGRADSVKGRILFLDDDDDTRELLDLVMSQAGYEIVSGRSVAEGLQLSKSRKFDFILLDWHFKDGSGVDLCRWIREFDPDTPIFFYTGIAYEQSLDRIIEAGAQGVFIKPVEFDTLLNTVSAEIDGRKPGKEPLPL